MQILTLLFLLPFIISTVYVRRGQIEKAFLQVYLPCLILLPNFFGYRIPHLPGFSAAQGALIPIALAVLFGKSYRWRPCRMDVWMILFIVSLTLSEVLGEYVFNDALMFVFQGIFAMFFPYVVGRQLLEPHLRLKTVKRIVILVLILAPIALYEFRMGANLYTVAAVTVFGYPSTGVWTQMRGGHPRISAAFSDAELAGIGFSVTFALNWWLVQVNKSDRGQETRLGKWLARLEKFHIPGWTLLLLLFLTRSRGPLLGTAAAVMVLQIPRFKNTRLVSVIAVILLVAGGAATYNYFDQQTAATLNSATVSEEEGSAAYRRLLLDNYAPIVQAGGWLGWGVLARPVVHGQESIDNQYLLLEITQGKLGLILFALIGADTIWRLACFTWTFKNREDLNFAFCLLAAMCGVWLTIGTVYLGEQLPQICFLLVGWSQSLQEGKAFAAPEQVQPQDAKFRFKRVIA